MQLRVVLGTALMALAACSLPLSDSGAEAFPATFQQMQADPNFLLSRAHPDLKIVEEFSSDGNTIEYTRVIPCGISEIQEAGWRVLPAPDLLAKSGTAYGTPVFDGPDQVSVKLGPAEGAVDALYSFRNSAGKWQLTRIEVYSYLESGAALPPLPCAGP